MQKVLFLLIFVLSMQSLFSEQYQIMIFGDKKEPLSDVNVISPYQYIISDTTGKVNLKVSPGNPMIHISKLGFKKISIRQNDLRKKSKVVLIRENIKLDPITVTGNEDKLSNSSLKNEVIDSEIIKNQNIKSVANWLSQTQGINIKGLDLIGEKKSISIGGHSAKHTIIMLNGIVLNPSGQEVDLSLIVAENIESIEVVKNNAGVESGSGGIAGIINIKTKQQFSDDLFDISQTFGSFSSMKTALMIQKRVKQTYLSFTYNQFHSDNDFLYYNKQTDELERRENNEKSQKQASLSVLTKIKNKPLSYQFQVTQYRNELPGTYNYSQAFAGSFMEALLIKNTLNFQFNTDHFNQELILFSNIDQSIYQNKKTSIPLYLADTSNHQMMSGAKLNQLIKSDFLNVKQGLEYKNEYFKSEDFLNPGASIGSLNRNTYSVYSGIEKTFMLPDFDYQHQLSGRIDYNQEFKDNYSIRYEQKLISFTRIPFEIYGNIGTSFNLPSFYDLYWKGDSQTVGNAKLKPERSKGYRLSFSIGDNPKFEQSYWINRSTDLIYWFRSLKAWKPDNIGEAVIQNIESQITYHFFKYHRLNFNYTQTQTWDKTKNEDGSYGDLYNKDLIYTPKYQFKGQYQFTTNIFNQKIEYCSTGKQYPTRDQFIGPLKGYEKWDSQSSIQYVYKKLSQELSVSFFNIFNKNYEIYDYIPEPGYNWQFMYKIQFKI